MKTVVIFEEREWDRILQLVVTALLACEKEDPMGTGASYLRIIHAEILKARDAD